MTASYNKFILNFKNPVETSRGSMTQKESWFLTIEDDGKKGIGECGLLRGLSYDDRPEYEHNLKWVCKNINIGEAKLWESLIEFPSIQFGIEMAFKSLENNNSPILFPSDFTNGKKSIPINGLVWMGNESFMLSQIQTKVENGFNCIKIKIGNLDLKKELGLLKFIRQNFSAQQIVIRLDANGAFKENTCLDILKKLSEYEIHSIEQPLEKGSKFYPEICKESPFPIALDEELIGILTYEKKETLLQKLNPNYIVLKPSFVGGYKGTSQWIELAEKYNIGWWITSALESNIGLSAIAQWTFLQNNSIPQGLGTGGLYNNNFETNLKVSKGQLWYKT